MIDRKTMAGTLTAFSYARVAALAALAASSIAGVAIFLSRSVNGLSHFRYYTIQSNIIIAGVAIGEIAIILGRKRIGKAFALLRLCAVIAILVTGLVYSIFLSGKVRYSGVMVLGNILCHYLSPFAAPLIWLAFAEKGLVGFRQAGAWLAYPMLYVAYALVQGRLTGFYPYWFLNPAKAPPEGIGSYPGVLAFVGIVSAAFLAIGFLMVLADKALSHKKRASG